MSTYLRTKEKGCQQTSFKKEERRTRRVDVDSLRNGSRRVEAEIKVPMRVQSREPPLSHRTSQSFRSSWAGKLREQAKGSARERDSALATLTSTHLQSTRKSNRLRSFGRRGSSSERLLKETRCRVSDERRKGMEGRKDAHWGFRRRFCSTFRLPSQPIRTATP